jgi:hypothetical protein
VSSIDLCSVFGVGDGVWGWCLFVSCMSRVFASVRRFWWLYFGFVKKRFWVLWFFLSMKRSFRSCKKIKCNYFGCIV